MQTDEFRDLLEERKRLIDERLGRLLPPGDLEPVTLHEAMRYSTLNGGKRIRGVLCLSFHELFGGDRVDAALDAACAIEVLHAYTLIHDDLPAIDDDDTRRGKASCHIRFGEPVAILAGDALQALAFEILSKIDVEDGLKVKAIANLARTAGSKFLVGGQVADIENEGGDVSEERVMFIHTRKTAELIASSMSIGAILSGASESEALEVHDIGRNVGLAFQIVDDILDETGDERRVGKKLRKDASRGKMTFPSLCGLDESRERARRLIQDSVERTQRLGDARFIAFIFSEILNRAF